MYAGSFNISASRTTVGIADSSGKILSSKILRGFQPDFKDHAAKCNALLGSCLNELNIDNSQLCGLGVALPGVFDVDSGLLIKAPFACWENAAATKIISEVTAVEKVVCANYVEACAQGEILFGNTADDFLWVSIGADISSAVVAERKIIKGSSFSAGQVGHIKIEFDKPKHCSCGQFGCVESECSGAAIANAFEELVLNNPGYRRILGANNLSVDTSGCAYLANEGDPGCLGIFAKAGRKLGIALSHCCNILNPREIYLGGELSQFFDLFIPHINSVIRTSCPSQCSKVEIKPTSLGSEAGLMGAAALVLAK